VYLNSKPSLSILDGLFQTRLIPEEVLGPEARRLYSFFRPVFIFLMSLNVPLHPLFVLMRSEVFVSSGPEVDSLVSDLDREFFIFLF